MKVTIFTIAILIFIVYRRLKVGSDLPEGAIKDDLPSSTNRYIYIIIHEPLLVCVHVHVRINTKIILIIIIIIIWK